MANRRIRRTKSLSGYLGSLNEDVLQINKRNIIRSVSANSIGSSEIGEDVVLDNKAISSANYLPGENGWKIDGYGNAEFANVFVRGDINAESGTIGYWNISQPLVNRSFGSTKLFGTFLESSDLGADDESTESGTYVGLYKSYIDEPAAITSAKRVSNIATVVATEHNYSVGDFIDVVITDGDSTFSASNVAVIATTPTGYSYANDGEDTAAEVDITDISSDGVAVTYTAINSLTPGEIVTITGATSTSYNLTQVPVNTTDGQTFTVLSDATGSTSTATAAVAATFVDITGSSILAIDDIAGLFLRDYGKVKLDYAYFSSEGVKYTSGASLNVVHNPSFEYYNDSGLLTSSTAGWTSVVGSVPAGGSAGIFDLATAVTRFDVESFLAYSFTWSTTPYSTSDYLKGTIDYSAGLSYNMFKPTSPSVYFNFTPHYDHSKSLPISVSSAAVTSTSVITITPAQKTSGTITSALASSPTVVVFTKASHPFRPGEIITTTGFSSTQYNKANVTVTATTSDTFTIATTGMTVGSASGTMGSAAGSPVKLNEIVYLDFDIYDDLEFNYAARDTGERFYQVRSVNAVSFTIDNYTNSLATGTAYLQARSNSLGSSKSISLYRLYGGMGVTAITVPLDGQNIVVTAPYHGLSVGDEIYQDFTALDDWGNDWSIDGYLSARTVLSVPNSSSYTISSPILRDAEKTLPEGTPVLTPAVSGTGFSRPTAVYKLPTIKYDISDIKIVYPNGESSNIRDLVTGDTLSQWGLFSSYEQYPSDFILENMDESSSVGDLRFGPLEISSAVLSSEYLEKDPEGFNAKSNIYVTLPATVQKYRYLAVSAVSKSAVTGGYNLTYTVDSNPFSEGDTVSLEGFNSYLYHDYDAEVVAATSTTITLFSPSDPGGAEGYLGFIYGYPAESFGVANSSQDNVRMIYDNVGFSRSKSFFFGGSQYAGTSWLDDTAKPLVSSLLESKEWINLDLENQTSTYRYVDYIGFTPSSSYPLLSTPYIGSGNAYAAVVSDESSLGVVTSPSTVSLYDPTSLIFSGGVFSRTSSSGTTISNSWLNSISSANDSGLEMVAYRDLTTTGTFEDGGSMTLSTAGGVAATGVWVDSSYKSYFAVLADNVSFLGQNGLSSFNAGNVYRNSGSAVDEVYATGISLSNTSTATTTSETWVNSTPAGFFMTNATGVATVHYGFRGENSGSTTSNRASFTIRYGLNSEGLPTSSGTIVRNPTSTNSATVQGIYETTSSSFYQFIGKPYTLYRINLALAVTGGTGSYFDRFLMVTPVS